jgi:hypothetical protein
MLSGFVTGGMRWRMAGPLVSGATTAGGFSGAGAAGVTGALTVGGSCSTGARLLGFRRRARAAEDEDQS